MNSASFGISNNFSASLDDVLDMVGSQSSGLDVAGVAGPSAASDGAAYASIGIDAEDAGDPLSRQILPARLIGETFSDCPLPTP